MCLLTNEIYKTYQTGFSFGRMGHALAVGLGGAGGQIFNFLNKPMWHIKFKGMISRTGYTEKFYPRIIPVTLGWGQKVKYH